jgi:4-hydroxybenzoate polyprenyltransferase
MKNVALGILMLFAVVAVATWAGYWFELLWPIYLPAAVFALWQLERSLSSRQLDMHIRRAAAPFQRV